MNATIQPRMIFRRLSAFAFGMLLYGFSVGLMASANVGVSPISSISYCMTFIFPGMTLGTAQMIVNTSMVLLQVLWLGRSFPIAQLLQIPASLFFSVVIDATMPLVRIIAGLASGVAFRGALFLLSLPIMSFGLSFVLYANFVMLPGDGMAKVWAEKASWLFGRAKVWVDCTCVLLTSILSFVFLRRLVGIQVGTVIAALVLGRLVRWLSKRLFAKRKAAKAAALPVQ